MVAGRSCLAKGPQTEKQTATAWMLSLSRRYLRGTHILARLERKSHREHRILGRSVRLYFCLDSNTIWASQHKSSAIIPTFSFLLCFIQKTSPIPSRGRICSCKKRPRSRQERAYYKHIMLSFDGIGSVFLHKTRQEAKPWHFSIMRYMGYAFASRKHQDPDAVQPKNDEREV